MPEVIVEAKEWSGDAWHVRATIITEQGVRAGPHVLDLPEAAADDDIKAALLALYGA